MRRVVYVVGIGCLFIVGYSFQPEKSGANFIGVSTVGLMAAGAAMLTGGLLGFLFGVPHTKQDGSRDTSGDRRTSPSQQMSSQAASVFSTTYHANTSLEQISDWLSKMLVGVGLVEIKVIPEKLKELSTYIARGLGNGQSPEVFALTIVLYFSVCGFVFGFLWARLYLARWFREADELQILGEKVSRLEQRQYADARALAVISQLNRPVDDTPLTDSEMAEMIKEASSPVRSQIFAQAEKTSANIDLDNYDVKNQAVVSILKALIASDTTERYHRNHSELSYAFSRQKPPNWKKAEEEITKAIEIREKMGKQGWRHYEFHRAQCRVEQDLNFKRRKPSEPEVVEQILKDLRQAYSDTHRWPKWYVPETGIRTWFEINNIEVAALQQP
jgi:hypothetical protein